LAELLIELHGGNAEIQWVEPLVGDIRHSRADISRARQLLDTPVMPLKDGLRLMEISIPMWQNDQEAVPSA
jgi:UDP-glucose 4-epimerase